MDDPSGKAAAAPNIITLGCKMINVPIIPTMIAMILRALIVSPRKTADKIVKIIGWAKYMAMASAMGRCCKAAKKQTVAMASRMP